jgi:hypothetical protein
MVITQFWVTIAMNRGMVTQHMNINYVADHKGVSDLLTVYCVSSVSIDDIFIVAM